MTAVALPRQTVAGRRSTVAPVLIVVCGLAAATATALRAADALQGILLFALLSALVAIATIDSVVLRAPNRVVYPACALATIAGFVVGVDSGLEALIGGVLAFAGVLAVVALGRGAMGYGDAKVAYVCGAVVGASNVLLMVVLTFAIGGLFAALAMTIGRRGRKDAVAFTPFLLVGVVLALGMGPDAVYRLTGGW